MIPVSALSGAGSPRNDATPRPALREIHTPTPYGGLVSLPPTRPHEQGPDAPTVPIARVEPRTPTLGVPVSGPSGAARAQHARPVDQGAGDVPGRYGPESLEAGSARLGPRLLGLLTAVLGAAAFAMVTHVALGTVRGQQLDESALAGTTFGQGTLWKFGEPVLDVVSNSFVVLALGGAILISLMRRRWGLAAQVVALVAGANLTTQILKHQVLERAELGVLTERPGNSLPSGHTTVAASVSIALLLVVPRRMRPAVALLGATYTALTGVSTLVGGWHRPSDVVAALLVVLVWTALVLALTPATGVDRFARHSEVGTTVATTLLAVGTVAAGALGAGLLTGSVDLFADRGQEVVDYLGTACVVVAATGLVFIASLLLRQSTARGRAEY